MRVSRQLRNNSAFLLVETFIRVVFDSMLRLCSVSRKPEGDLKTRTLNTINTVLRTIHGLSKICREFAVLGGLHTTVTTNG